MRSYLKLLINFLVFWATVGVVIFAPIFLLSFILKGFFKFIFPARRENEQRTVASIEANCEGLGTRDSRQLQAIQLFESTGIGAEKCPQV